MVEIQSRLDTVLSLQEREQHEREHARREALKAREELRIETESIVALRWEHWHAKDELRKEKEARERDKERMEVGKEQFAKAALQLEKRLHEAQQHVRLYPLNDTFVRNWEGLEDFRQSLSHVHSPTASPRAVGGKSRETTVGEDGKMPSEPGHSEAAQTVAAEKSIRALSLQVDALKAENQVLAARARLMGTEQTVLLKAITAFVNVFRDKAVLNLNTNNQRVLKRQLEATRDRFQVGEISRTDVHQAEARMAKAIADHNVDCTKLCGLTEAAVVALAGAYTLMYKKYMSNSRAGCCAEAPSAVLNKILGV